MDNLLEFASAVSDARYSLEDAIEYGNDITYEKWPEMNDYLNRLQEILGDLQFPPGVADAVLDAEQAYEDGDARQDALSY